MATIDFMRGVSAAGLQPSADVNYLLLCGGRGARLLPLSTEALSKPFLPLLSEVPMVRETFLRVAGGNGRGPINAGHVYASTAERYIGFVREHLPELPEGNIVGPCCDKGTFPAVAYPIHMIAAKDPDAVVAVLPSDHYIENPHVLVSQIAEAARWAAVTGNIVTFGVRPSWTDTGYGYINSGRDLESGFHRVKSFTEKPCRELAEHFVATGEYLWNSGIYVIPVSAFLECMRLYARGVYDNLVRRGESYDSMQTIRASMGVFFDEVPNAQLEHSIIIPAVRDERVYVTPLRTGWSDVGSLAALRRLYAEGRISPSQEVVSHIMDRAVSP